MAPIGERRAWLEIVKPAELDVHMASIGQAETNASIVRQMFEDFPLTDGARLLVHGCGSCQMLDYISLTDLGNVEFAFADLSPAMLEEGRRRLARTRDATYSLTIDDIEHSALTGHYDAVLLVLVLLHVEWRSSLENVMRLNPRRIYIVEQEQAPGASSVTMKEKLLPSIEEYSAVSGMTPVPRADLTMCMEAMGYIGRWAVTRPVSDDKSMMGFVFERMHREPEE